MAGLSYASKLPKTVGLEVQTVLGKTIYVLYLKRDRTPLARRDETLVNKWRDPAKVFASIANRSVRMRSAK